ncbi:S8 family serine peptidase [Deinococcus petrolearius]|uniref:S8 family serine peptidase n=1 Tax=Deinococcus petrolearius TaxID=1751295 RepID=A0ABW1DPE3_9DEIO
MTHRIPAAFALLTLSLLSACSTTGTPAQASQPQARYTYVATVPLQAGDTRESLARAVGGEVLAWNEEGCVTGAANDCSALVGFTPKLGSAGVLSALSGRKVQVEANKDVFSGGGKTTAIANGTIAIWAGGTIAIWAGGTIAIWAGGEYSPIPQNSGLWQQIKLEQAQQLAPHVGEGVTVAVIDSGIDLQHPAFQGALADASTWRDFYAGDDVPQEEGVAGEGAYGHGTNVAGIILQIAPKAKIMPLRVLGADGSGDVASVTQAIRWAVEKGAQVINLSLGSAENSPAVQAAIDWATAQDVLVVASAGNENADHITYPAANASQGSAAPNLLSVGSVDPQDLKSSFSNYGAALEVVGPGENVYAPAPDGRMASWSGTSMAAPMTAGGLALALAEDLKVPVRSLTGAMAQTAGDIYAGGANASYTGLLGQGRLDLAAFLGQTIR